MQSDHKLVRVLTALYTEPWLISPPMHKTLCDIALAHSQRGSELEAAQHLAAARMPVNQANKEYEVIDGVAVVPVEGVIGRKFSSSLKSSGVVSIDIFEKLIQEVRKDDKAQAVVLRIDSPGGVVTGTPEAGSAVRALRNEKPIIAFADGRMDSAAYWVGSQADLIYAMPSSRVGSIGVYMAFFDQSRRAEMLGMKLELFKDGRFKGMGYPGSSLNDEQRALLQASVEKIGATFRATVQDGRGRVFDEELMQGQDFDAEDALHNGLIDSITTLEAAMRDAASLAKMRNR